MSVIIPAFNAAHFVGEAIESVIRQSYCDYEIILVDDGSSDYIAQAIRNLSAEIKFVRQNNRGVGAARNHGVRLANGRYLVFLDADDILLPKKLEYQVDYLDKHPDVDVVYSDGHIFDNHEGGSESRDLFSNTGFLDKCLGEPHQNVRRLSIHNAFPIHAAMMRIQAFLNVGGFDENRALMSLADWDFWYRVGESHTFAYLDAVLVKYRMVATGISNDNHRQTEAIDAVEDKIEISSSFQCLPRSLQSKFYLNLGLMRLEFENPGLALDKFRKSIRTYPLNPIALIAYMMTLILANRIRSIYPLKRKIFVALGLRRL